MLPSNFWCAVSCQRLGLLQSFTKHGGTHPSDCYFMLGSTSQQNTVLWTVFSKYVVLMQWLTCLGPRAVSYPRYTNLLIAQSSRSHHSPLLVSTLLCITVTLWPTLLQSRMNCRKRWNKIYHPTPNLLPHYLVKIGCSTVQLFIHISENNVHSRRLYHIRCC